MRPQHQHDCDNCTFLGRLSSADLYRHGREHEATYIVRYSSDGPDYASTCDFGFGKETDLRHKISGGNDVFYWRITLLHLLATSITNLINQDSMMVPEPKELKLDLDEWIQVEDALEAIRQGQSSAAFVQAHVEAYHRSARIAYARAVDLIAHYTDVSKALDFVNRQIQLQGASDAEVHPQGIPEDRRSE